ncbi:MAG: 4-hydroxybenzoate octaprenyltransferase [Acidobacteria bacterium]|nr:4-hydroxybenzoate octaprenyltransferase [Acidobacteriota bacterium]MYF77524.1 4-hydroxybenzoate octaprenyltransferase [Acidobacteriota bacterium]
MSRDASSNVQNPLGHRLKVWAEYLKIEHTLFSVPLIYAGALLAEPPLTPRTAVLILVAATGARTAALGLNRILDRHLDAQNPRTANRALPAGAISLRGAVAVAMLAFMVALVAAWAISPRCLIIAPVPLAAFVGYPLLKRTTRWAHLGLGVTLALGPLCGFYAVALEWRGLFPILMLSAFTALWSAGFDILYATLDEESDRRTGVFSLPAAIGSRRAVRVAAGMHALAFAALMILFSTSLHGAVSGLLFALTGGLFVLQHLLRQHVNFAFFQVNAVLGCVVFLGVVLSRTAIPGS